MSKNLIPEVAKLLGVVVGEEFKIAGNDLTYRFTDDSIEYRCNSNCDGVWHTAFEGGLMKWLDGRCNVVKLPWHPQLEDEYWTYAGNSFFVVRDNWLGTPENLAMLKCGCVFRTNEEALEARPRLYKELTGKDWEGEKIIIN